MTQKGYKIKRGGMGSMSEKKPVKRWRLAGLLGVAAAALALAYFWQGDDPAHETLAATDGTGSAVGEESQARGQDGAQPDIFVVGPPTPTPDPTPGAAQGDPAAESPSTPAIVVGPNTPPPSAGSLGEKVQDETAAVAGSFEMAYQIPAGEAVGDAYFDDALFVGDGLTARIPLYNAMNGADVVASASINPSTLLTKPVIRDEIGQLHTMLEAMAAYNPRKIYILMGASGVGWIGKEAFIEYYEAFIDAVATQHPGAQIYIQSILPVTMEKSLSDSSLYANEKIDAYNEALMEMCRRKGLPFLNVAQCLRGADGALPAEGSADGIQISAASYNSWYEYLKTHTVTQTKKEEQNK